MKRMLFILTSLFLAQIALSQTSDSPYDHEYAASDGLRRVRYQGKFGYINDKGREVVSPKFSKASDFRHGLAEVSLDGKSFGFIEPGGRTVLPLEYEDFLYGFQDGYVPAKKNGKWGIVNAKGKTIVSHDYSYIYYYFDGLVNARKSDGQKEKYGFLNEKGEVSIPFIYDNARPFEEGLACVSKDGLYGYIDKKGKIVIPFQYEEARGFANGRAAIKIDGKWGFIDRNNKMVIKPIYTAVYGFQNGEAEVLAGDDAYYIDPAGNRLKPGRWLLLFTKGLNLGEQFWYRNPTFTEALGAKYNEGFRYTDIQQNKHEKEYFVIMSKGHSRAQSPFYYRYATDKAWEKIKGLNKDGKFLTNISYGGEKWNFVATDGRNGAKETITKTNVFPEERIAAERQKNMFVTSIVHGDGTWIVVFQNERYTDQVIKEYEYDRWNQADIDKYFKEGYAITDIVKYESSYYIVFTKGTGIKEQRLVWSNEIPLREIKSYWDKGYKSYKSFYLPRYVSINKSLFGY